MARPQSFNALQRMIDCMVFWLYVVLLVGTRMTDNYMHDVRVSALGRVLVIQ